MSFQIKSPELREVQDTGLAVMREARARTAHLKYGKLAIDGGKLVIGGRKEDLVERLNEGKLTEMEAKVIEAQPLQPAKAVEKRNPRKRAA